MSDAASYASLLDSKPSTKEVREYARDCEISVTESREELVSEWEYEVMEKAVQLGLRPPFSVAKIKQLLEECYGDGELTYKYYYGRDGLFKEVSDPEDAFMERDNRPHDDVMDVMESEGCGRKKAEQILKGEGFKWVDPCRYSDLSIIGVMRGEMEMGSFYLSQVEAGFSNGFFLDTDWGWVKGMEECMHLGTLVSKERERIGEVRFASSEQLQKLKNLGVEVWRGITASEALSIISESHWCDAL